MPEDDDGSNSFSRLGWIVALTGVVAGYAARQRLRRGAASMARVAADTLETSSELVERSIRGAGRVALLPADATLALARDRILGGLPEAADTKWRVAQLLLRVTAVNAISRDPAAGADLDSAGSVYARASLPDGSWDAVTLRETVRRATHALDLVGTEQRTGAVIEVITTACPLIEGVADAQRPDVCEAICGETASLLHGLATAAGATIESPERMGQGDPRCRRLLTLTNGIGTPSDLGRG